MPYLIIRVWLTSGGRTSLRGHGADLPTCLRTMTGQREDYGCLSKSAVVGGVVLDSAGALIAACGWSRADVDRHLDWCWI